jgi:8-amino-3,8-dideoxy-alpha-D-manno-octulosonate transaminase
LTAAVGLAQLRKIDHILSETKRQKYILKDMLKHIPGLDMRKFHDEDGAQGDTLIFSMETNALAVKLEQALMSAGFGTKILPEAIDWHFAGVWNHVFTDKSLEELENEFKVSGDLLRRSICLNIPVLLSSASINAMTNVIADFSSAQNL